MSNGLGRGLGSLIPSKPAADSKANDSAPNTAVGKDKVLQVDIEKIKGNPMQPRRQFADSQLDELANSIKEYGVIQPLIVSSEGSGFELIAGERRLRAAKLAGLEKVPVIIREAGKEEKLEVALIENIQREDLNPIDLGKAYKQLMDEFGLNQEQIAKKVGKARSSITNTVRMLSLPQEAQDALADSRLTEAHAKYLLGIDDPQKQLALFNKIIRNSLSVRETTAHAQRLGGTKQAKIKINYRDKDKEFAFREFFGAKAEVKRKRAGGQIIIHFFSDDELEEIVAKVK